jgi:hypothetical protein
MVSTQPLTKGDGMITAKQAYALFEPAGKEVNNYLKYTVEPKVTRAAETGNRNVTIFLGSIPVYEIQNLKRELDSLYVAASNKLKELGYAVEIQVYGEKYCPSGLADDDGNGPQYMNYGLYIGW